MNRFHYILVFAITIAIPCAYSQTWDLGKDGAVKQTQTATKGTKNQNAGDQANSKATTKTSASDDDLKQQVNQQFGTDTSLRYILVEVQNGSVTLSGTVPSKADKKRAVRLAKLVRGVRKVHDSLTVDANASSSGDNEPTNARNIPPKPKTTAAARPHTRATITSANRAVASTNKTAVEGGNSSAITNAGNSAGAETHLGSSSGGSAGGIAGAAASASSAAAADPGGSNSGAVARNTGVTTTDFSAIPVPMMRPLASTATLKGQIENALRNDSQVGGSNLNVNVTDTTIELSGSVATGKERTAAYRIAQSFALNRRVQDHMTVTGRNAAGAAPDSNSSAPAGNVNSGKPAVGSSSAPRIPKSNATADGNAFRPPRL